MKLVAFRFFILVFLITMFSVFPAYPLIRGLIYPAPRLPVPTSPPGQFTGLVFNLGDKSRVTAWRLLSALEGDSIPVVCYFYGNGENLEALRQSGIFHKFHDMGVHVAVLDYPGYGNSTGKPSESSILQASDSLVAYLKREFPQNPLFIAGWSLGAAVAIATASRWQEKITGLIALSPWTTLPDCAAAHYPRWLVDLLLKETWNSLGRAETLNIPSLVIHGKDDRLIPASQGKTIAQALPRIWRFEMVMDCGHNDLLHFPSVWGTMGDFISTASDPIDNK